MSVSVVKSIERAAKSAVKESQKEFVKRLASYADCYINDAFGTAHRAHASTALIADYFPEDKMFGYVMENELKAIDGVMENPARPFCAIIGGSKVSTKITIIEKLMEKVDSIIIGGGMTYTFAGAEGGKEGKSICEPDMFPVALEILKKAEERGIKILQAIYLLPQQEIVMLLLLNTCQKCLTKPSFATLDILTTKSKWLN